ncbi:MAG TPA: alanine dehydrogenase, partial [Chloroflexota bacterium]|nr:alanine dehydrogenase [Chloroflexota bacterium]
MTTIGIPKEVRDLERRIGLAPAGVSAMKQAGHTIYVQAGAGAGAGFSDEAYQQAGALIAYSAGEVYGRADIIA